MRPRGADRPDGDADQRNEQPGKSRRLFGRARPEPIEPEVVPTEETGWLDDLRTAKHERGAIGPGKATDGKSSKSGKKAPAPDDVPDDAPALPGAFSAPPGASPAPRGASPAQPGASPAQPGRPEPLARPDLTGRPDQSGRPRADRPTTLDDRPPAGPPPSAPSPFGASGVVGRPVSPPPPAPATGSPRTGPQNADGTWSAEQSGSWRTVPGQTTAGRRLPSPLNPDGTDEAGPGRGRRQLDPGQLSGRIEPTGGAQPGRPVSGSPAAGPVSAVPMSGNAPGIPGRPTSPAAPRRGQMPAPAQPGPTGPVGRAAPPTAPPTGGRHASGEFAQVQRHDQGTTTGRRAAPDDAPPRHGLPPAGRDNVPALDEGRHGREDGRHGRGGADEAPRPAGAGQSVGRHTGEYPQQSRGGTVPPAGTYGTGKYGTGSFSTVSGDRPRTVPGEEGTGRHGMPTGPVSGGNTAAPAPRVPDGPSATRGPGFDGGGPQASRAQRPGQGPDGQRPHDQPSGPIPRGQRPARPADGRPQDQASGPAPRGPDGRPPDQPPGPVAHRQDGRPLDQPSGPIPRGPDGRMLDQPSGPIPRGQGRSGQRPVEEPPGPARRGQRPGAPTGRRSAGETGGNHTGGWPAVNPAGGPDNRATTGGAVVGGAAAGAAGQRGANQPARASAPVMPPVVPGREGARPPAMPGRAGAMADSPSGVIQRPGETTGRIQGRGTGRIPRPGQAEPASGGRGNRGLVRPGEGEQPQSTPAGAPMPGTPGQGRTGPGRPGETSRSIPVHGRPAPGDVSQPIPVRGRPGEPGPVYPGDVSQPIPGRARPAEAQPGDVSQPIPVRGRPGEAGPVYPGDVSRPIPGRARPGDVSQPLRAPGSPVADQARPGDVSRPVHGLSGAPIPGRPAGGHPDQPGPDRTGTGPVHSAAGVSPPVAGPGARTGEVSRPVPGRDQTGDSGAPSGRPGEPGRPAAGQPGETSRRIAGNPGRPPGQPGETSRRIPGDMNQAPGRPDGAGQHGAGQHGPGQHGATSGDVSQRLPGRPGPAVPGPGDAGRDVRPAPQSLADIPGPDPRTAPGHSTGPIPRGNPGHAGGPVPHAAPARPAEPGRPGDGPGPVAASASVRSAGIGAVATVAAPAPAVVDEDDRESAHGVPPQDDATATGPVAGLRAKLRSQRRLRVISLISLSVLVLGLLPLFFGVRAATRDPVFASLDALDVPAWAAVQVDDKSSGSRWCFLNCRFRERTAQSEQASPETAKAYSDALTRAGWQPWQVESCPEQPISDGSYTCWRRDEFTLDLWVRLPECAVDVVAQQDPATLPSTGPDGIVEQPAPGECVGSTVSIKVQNAITDQRGKPQPAPDPGLIGETPDPVLSNDPLLDPTPSPS